MIFYNVSFDVLQENHHPDYVLHYHKNGLKVGPTWEKYVDDA